MHTRLCFPDQGWSSPASHLEATRCHLQPSLKPCGGVICDGFIHVPWEWVEKSHGKIPTHLKSPMQPSYSRSSPSSVLTRATLGLTPQGSCVFYRTGLSITPLIGGSHRWVKLRVFCRDRLMDGFKPGVEEWSLPATDSEAEGSQGELCRGAGKAHGETPSYRKKTLI